jgi:hypothetical protein
MNIETQLYAKQFTNIQKQVAKLYNNDYFVQQKERVFSQKKNTHTHTHNVTVASRRQNQIIRNNLMCTSIINKAHVFLY